jgi:hypothetical protein
MSPVIAGAASPTGPREAELSARGMTCACRTALAGKTLSGRRLIAALVSVGPLSDLSVVVPLFPWPGFRGWQRVLATAGGTGQRQEGSPCLG